MGSSLKQGLASTLASTLKVAISYFHPSPRVKLAFYPHDTMFSEELEKPLVSIIIPTRDRVDLLKICIESIFSNTSYPNFEVVIVDNGSKELETTLYFASLFLAKVSVVKSPGKFNFSKLINVGVQNSSGEVVVSLNNDTKIDSPLWLERIVAHLADPGVGVVGVVLLKPTLLIQHIGIAFGLRGLATHPLSGHPLVDLDSLRGPNTSQLVSAVTFACAGFLRSTHSSIGGLDETFPVGLNDVDFCIRANGLGKRNVVDFSVRVFHHESQSRRNPHNNVLGVLTATRDVLKLLRKHPKSALREVYFLTNN